MIDYDVFIDTDTGEKYGYFGKKVGFVKLQTKQASPEQQRKYELQKDKAVKWLDDRESGTRKKLSKDSEYDPSKELRSRLEKDEISKRQEARKRVFETEFGGATPVGSFADLTRVLVSFMKNEIVNSKHDTVQEPYEDRSLMTASKSATYRATDGEIMSAGPVTDYRWVEDPEPLPEDEVPHIEIYLDVSGSFTARAMKEFANQVLSELIPYTMDNEETGEKASLAIDYWYFADRVGATPEAAGAGGGTNIDAVIRKVKEHEAESRRGINVMVVTDGQYSASKEATVSGGVFFYFKKGYSDPVMWRTFESGKVPIISGRETYFSMDTKKVSLTNGDEIEADSGDDILGREEEE